MTKEIMVSYYIFQASLLAFQQQLVPDGPSTGLFLLGERMDRCAVFVDAGHLLAEGGKLCCGSAARTRVQCDYTGLVNARARFATSHCGLSILRIYWYDAAPEAIPTQEQLTIAELARVKLRLGRLVSGKQKGVDSLIVRDLMMLARERAVTTVFLLGGDEDLREGVVAAHPPGQEAAQLAGRSFAADWVRRATAEEIRRLLDQAPILPNHLDRELLAAAETALGSLHEQKSLRKDLRSGFWKALQDIPGAPPI